MRGRERHSTHPQQPAGRRYKQPYRDLARGRVMAVAERAAKKAAAERARSIFAPPPPPVDPEEQARRERSLARAREARANGRHFGTICGRWGHHTRVPDLRLSGNWLRAAGFDFGQHFEIEVEAGTLTIRAVE